MWWRQPRKGKLQINSWTCVCFIHCRLYLILFFPLFYTQVLLCYLLFILTAHLHATAPGGCHPHRLIESFSKPTLWRVFSKLLSTSFEWRYEGKLYRCACMFPFFMIYIIVVYFHYYRTLEKTYMITLCTGPEVVGEKWKAMTCYWLGCQK